MTSTTGTRSRTRGPGIRALLVASLSIALLAHGTVTASAKDLDEYATWDDVVAAQGDIDEQNRLIDEINGQIDQLKQDVADAEVVAAARGEEYAAASDKVSDQNAHVYTLQLQADDADAEATEAEQDAGAMAAAMSNRVTVDPTIQLLTDPNGADDFLMGMSTLSKLGTHNGSVYELAISARNNATQLTDQASVALEELERLEADAHEAYEAAKASQLGLQDKRDAAIMQGSELEAMLIPLMEHRDVVEADYEEGERLREEERKRIEAERKAAAEAAAKAEEERRRAAAEEAANSGGGSGGGGGGGSYTPPSSGGSNGGDGGSESPSVSAGYSYPMSPYAYVTSPYGMRVHPVWGTWRMHNGLDLVEPGGTCWTPLYAIDDGYITYSGWLPSFGNTVVLESASGPEQFKYAHISDGGLNVWAGQYVNAGDVIAYAGTTGDSTGCHLHLETTQWGSFVDPQLWLSNRGMSYW